jgi:hypothetical protein
MTSPTPAQKPPKASPLDFVATILVGAIALFLAPVVMHSYLQWGLSTQMPPSSDLLWLMSLGSAGVPFLLVALTKATGSLKGNLTYSFTWATVTAPITVVILHYYLAWVITVSAPTADAFLWLASVGALVMLLLGFLAGSFCFLVGALVITLIASA